MTNESKGPSRVLRALAGLLLGLSAAWACAALETTERAADETRVPRTTRLEGTIVGTDASELTLTVHELKRPVPLDDEGRFSHSVELGSPTFVYAELPSRQDESLAFYLRPGEDLSFRCESADPYRTARFEGGTASENAGLARLASHYAGIDYRGLFASSPEVFLRRLRGEQEALEEVLTAYAREHPGLDPGFLRLERARITYLGALLRVLRLGFSHGWDEYAAGLDLNDPSLLDVDTYTSFLRRYTKGRAQERSGRDAALSDSVNLQTEARYSVAAETFTDPEVRSVQLYAVLLNQFTDEDDGPFGCKGLEALMSRFAVDCTNPALREDIQGRYHACLEGRDAPEIRVYKTVGTTTLDAHIFPAAGAEPAERRPAYLFFHGGGWAAGMPEWGYGQCRHFAEKGLVGISFEYRLRWRHGTTPLEAVEDARSAVRWVRTHADELRVDPHRVAVAGFSAGGHLAAVTGVLPSGDDSPAAASEDARADAMILMSAAVDVAADPWYRECLAGRADPVDSSPAAHVREGLPPTLLFHGREDHLCAFHRTETFCRELRAAGNRCELHEFAGGHFRGPDEWATITRGSEAFLASLGFIETAAPDEVSP